LLAAATIDGATEPDAEADGDATAIVDTGADAVGSTEIAEPVALVWAAWDVAGAPDVAGIPWPPQAVPARPTSPTTRAVAASLAVELL
jgi:hypothetical protein